MSITTDGEVLQKHVRNIKSSYIKICLIEICLKGIITCYNLSYCHIGDILTMAAVALNLAHF